MKGRTLQRIFVRLKLSSAVGLREWRPWAIQLVLVSVRLCGLLSVQESEGQ